jgi:hypothetical protein
MKTKSLLLWILCFPFCTLASEPEPPICLDWGFFGHKKINELAIYTLPPDLFGFYKYNMNYLIEHSVDPDKRRYSVKGEAECHFLDVDRYVTETSSSPFENLPERWNDAVSKYGEDSLRAHGIVPWNLYFVYSKLVKAFAEKDVNKVLRLSAEIGHYVGDVHVPLHSTSNYNGQKTNQKGIHGFWESRVPEIQFPQYDFFVGQAEYISAPQHFIWDRLKESYAAVDSVLKFEEQLTARFPSDKKYAYEMRNNIEVRTYSKEFSEAYSALLNGQIERRMRSAVYSLGCLWLSAWSDAGQPNLEGWYVKEEETTDEPTEHETKNIREHE